MGAVAGLGLATAAQAAPIINMSLIVRDLSSNSGAVIAPTSVVAGVPHYSMAPGTVFRIESGNSIANPFQTDANHTSGATDSPVVAPTISLGMQNLTYSIQATGAGIVSARNIADSTSTAVSPWARDATGTVNAAKLDAALGTANAFDPATSDGDNEVFGVTYSNNSAPWNYDTAASGTGFTHGSATSLGARGAWKAVAAGTSLISTNVSTANIFYDPAANDNSLLPANALIGEQGATLTNATIAIDVAAIPEPASLGLLSMSAIGFMGRRRRKA
jgi:hypothetical protein